MPRITITVPDQVEQPYRFSLDRQIVHFGRGDDNDIFVDSGSVSSEHCVMERIIGGYVLKDSGSTNGIKLNGERVDKISLRNGQDIHVGDVAFGFELNEEEITALRLEDPTSSLPPLKDSPTEGPKDSSSKKTSPEIELKDEPKKEELPKEKEAEPLPDLKADPEPQPQQQPEPQPQELPPQQDGIQQVNVPPQQNPMQQAMAQFNASDDGKFNKLIGTIAVVAFLVGIAMHFQRRTDESIITAIIQKFTG